jgi:hypothetical protein
VTDPAKHGDRILSKHLTKRQVFFRASRASANQNYAVVIMDAASLRWLWFRRPWTPEEQPHVRAVFYDDHLVWSASASDTVQNVFGSATMTLDMIGAEMDTKQ